MTMATKTDIFNKINEYVSSNDRKCPAKELAVMLGVKTVTERKAFDALLKSMKDSGEIVSKKGRGGGLFIPENVETVVSTSEVETEDSTEDIFEAQPVYLDGDEAEIVEGQDRSDESYDKLMKMSSGEIPMDEEWVKANWPDAWHESTEEDLMND